MTAQASLFDAEQSGELARVTGQIGNAILRFCRHRLATGRGEFHADELREYVSQGLTAAPGSADRVLRALRRSGFVAYHVVNRAQSLYRIVSVS